MIIKKIKLQRFKRFRDLEAELSPGLNVIKGPNEAGKSTLHSALIAGLFFNPSHRRKEVRNLISWGSERMYEIGLDVEDEGANYALHKDFETKKLTLIGDGLPREIIDPVKVGEKVGQWLGFSSAAVFKSTACIEQDRVAQISKGEREIGDSLQATITGEDEVTASWACERLKVTLKELIKGEGKITKYPGEIQKLSNAIAELEEKRRQLEDEIEEVRRTSTRLFEVERELKDLSTELSTKMNLKCRNERRRWLEQELEKIEECYQNIQRAFGIKHEIDDLNERLKPYSFLEKIEDEDVDALRTLLGRKQSLEQMRDSLEQQLVEPSLAYHEARLERSLPLGPAGQIDLQLQSTPTGNYPLILGTILLLLGIIGAFLSKFMLILAIVGLLVAGYGVLRIKPEPQVDLGTVVSQIRYQKIKVEEQITEINDQIKYLLAKARCKTATECLERYEKYKPLRAEKLAKDSELSGILGDKSIEDLVEESRTLALDRNAKKEEWESLDPIALDPEQFQKLLQEIEDLAEKKRAIDEEKKELEIVISKARATSEDLAAIDEKLADLQQRLEFYQRRRRVYELVLKSIDEARESTLRSATKVLEEEVSRYINIITNGKYNRVKVNQENLEFFVYSEEKKDYVKAGELSRATIDQIYLSARLGLVKLISKGKKPPLLFDDPFITFDDERLRNTMELVKEIAKEYQIILFTCSDRYDAYADKVIDLSR
ncbi:MAG: AAA family ATPase [Actinomycetota bacterium]|nr:AAA family ATPase [Actinomycetota bacterium]MDI6821736.1 AAA family ATPase [Actinomycetota bacterium]